MILRKLGALSIVSLLSLAVVSAAAETDAIQSRIAEMSLREKVGQIFMIRPDALDAQYRPDLNKDDPGMKALTGELRDFYAQYPCGGFCIFTQNIENPNQLRKLTEELHALGGITPLLSIDEEGGRVARIGNHPYGFNVPRIEPMGEIAASGNLARAYEAARAIGTYLREYGLDLDFAPVADLNTNPNNPVIGNRAFGDDPVLAADMVIQYLYGLRDAGIAGCMKHFPGHGDTSTDTHLGYAETEKTWEEIRACEMIPFMAGIAVGCDMIMTAHIAAPAVTGTKEPSTVSHIVLTEKLRNELGFNGVIVTDALEMGAIHQNYTDEEATVKCFLAGADMVLLPYDYVAAFESVVAAVEDGTIPVERLDESVYRILTFKEKWIRQAGDNR